MAPTIQPHMDGSRRHDRIPHPLCLSASASASALRSIASTYMSRSSTTNNADNVLIQTHKTTSSLPRCRTTPSSSTVMRNSTQASFLARLQSSREERMDSGMHTFGHFMAPGTYDVSFSKV